MAARALAGLAALVSLGGLALQLGLTVQDFLGHGRTAAAAIWRFLAFFSILANLAVVLVGGAMALAPRSRLADPRVRMATATAITIVAIVYSVALRSLYDLDGLWAVSSRAMHDVGPPLFLLAWALSEHGALAWSDALWALVGPSVYTVYGLARGLAEGWYPYWFLDLDALPIGVFLLNAVLIIAGFLLIGLIFVALDRWLGRVGRARAESAA